MPTRILSAIKIIVGKQVAHPTVLTAAIAIVLLDEQLQGYHLLGGAITLVGILFAQSWTRELGRDSKNLLP